MSAPTPTLHVSEIVTTTPLEPEAVASVISEITSTEDGNLTPDGVLKLHTALNQYTPTAEQQPAYASVKEALTPVVVARQVKEQAIDRFQHLTDEIETLNRTDNNQEIKTTVKVADVFSSEMRPGARAIQRVIFDKGLQSSGTTSRLEDLLVTSVDPAKIAQTFEENPNLVDKLLSENSDEAMQIILNAVVPNKDEALQGLNSLENISEETVQQIRGSLDVLDTALPDENAVRILKEVDEKVSKIVSSLGYKTSDVRTYVNSARSEFQYSPLQNTNTSEALETADGIATQLEQLQQNNNIGARPEILRELQSRYNNFIDMTLNYPNEHILGELRGKIVDQIGSEISTYNYNPEYVEYDYAGFNTLIKDLNAINKEDLDLANAILQETSNGQVENISRLMEKLSSSDNTERTFALDQINLAKSEIELALLQTNLYTESIQTTVTNLRKFASTIPTDITSPVRELATKIARQKRELPELESELENLTSTTLLTLSQNETSAMAALNTPEFKANLAQLQSALSPGVEGLQETIETYAETVTAQKAIQLIKEGLLKLGAQVDISQPTTLSLTDGKSMSLNYRLTSKLLLTANGDHASINGQSISNLKPNYEAGGYEVSSGDILTIGDDTEQKHFLFLYDTDTQQQLLIPIHPDNIAEINALPKDYEVQAAIIAAYRAGWQENATPEEITAEAEVASDLSDFPSEAPAEEPAVPETDPTAELQDEIESLRQQLADAVGGQEIVEQQNTDLRAQLNQTTTQIEQVTEVQTKLTSTETDLVEARKALAARETSLGEANTQILQLKQQLQQAQAELQEGQSTPPEADAQQELSRVQEELRQLREAKTLADQEKADLQTQLDKANQEKNHALADLQAAQIVLETLRAEADTANQAKIDAQTEAAQLREALQTASDAAEAQQARADGLQGEKVVLVEQLTTAQREKQEAEALSDRLNEQLRTANGLVGPREALLEARDIERGILKSTIELLAAIPKMPKQILRTVTKPATLVSRATTETKVVDLPSLEVPINRKPNEMLSALEYKFVDYLNGILNKFLSTEITLDEMKNLQLVGEGKLSALQLGQLLSKTSVYRSNSNIILGQIDGVDITLNNVVAPMLEGQIPSSNSYKTTNIFGFPIKTAVIRSTTTRRP